MSNAIAITTAESNSPQVLYRFFDANNQLLYVGISSNFFNRVSGHKADKAWFSEIAYATFEHHSNRASVDAAETNAILTEKPLHNKAKQPDYVPVDFHIKTIDSGSIYNHARWNGRHDWMKPYVEARREASKRLAPFYDKRIARLWLVSSAYRAAKAAGYECLSCETLLTHDNYSLKFDALERWLAKQ